MRNSLHAIIIVIFALLAFIANTYAANNFFEQRYRGWLWFEDKPKLERQKERIQNQLKHNSQEPTIEDMKQAKEENERFKEELELHRHLMVRYPDNIEYVRKYKEKENEMLDKSMTLAKSFAMTNFLYPDITDQLELPQNMYGRKIYKELEQQAHDKKVKFMASKLELFVFRKEGCIYCDTLEKHLYTFANKHNFNVEAVSVDASDSGYFKTHHDQDLIQQLKLEVMPTVIAVFVDTKERFELARGAVSTANLEDACVMLFDYLEERK